MPPASKKFRANMVRAMKSAELPRLARKIFGRDPVFFNARSEASRNASNGSDNRIGVERGEGEGRRSGRLRHDARDIENRDLFFG